MAKISVLDKYPNMVRIAQYVSEVAATVHAPAKVTSQYNPKDMLAMLIQRVTYTFNKTRFNLDAILDEVWFGLCLAPAQPTGGYNQNSAGLLDYNCITTQYGTLVGAFPGEVTIERDFTDLRGGGLICHPASLYTWSTNACTANMAAAVTWVTQIYYTLEEITPQDWQEMWQLGYINNVI